MVKSFSSLCKLLQITAWANRFVKNCRSKQKIGALTSSEITKARVQWIKHVQYEVIDTMDVKKLQNNDVITLGLKIDEDGILRYHGRFNNADISEETKIPIYLPRKNYWTELLVKRISSKVISWWIITYTITNSKPLLDPTRTSYGKKRDMSLWNMQKNHGGPFKMPKMSPYTGLGYLGPFYVKGNPSKKIWICLFTCVAARAVHL